MRRILLVLVMLAAVSPAVADDTSLIRPRKDVAVEYRSAGAAQGAAADPGRVVTMRFSSKSSRIRIDGAEGHGYAILDIDTGHMIIVMTERHMYIERPADPGMVAMFQARNAAFRKTGTDTVAGVQCTTYDATINERTGQVCLTDDGVMLRARSADPGSQSPPGSAVKVTYAEQPGALFETPSGYRQMNVPDMPHELLVPPGAVPRGKTGR